MRRMIISALALALAAAPAVLEAQTPRPDRPGMQRAPMGMRGQAMANPAARVLAQREALGLTAAQVSQLEQIQAQAEARNQPLREQLQAALPASAGQPMRQRAADLTPEQRAEMRERMQAQRGQMQAQREQMTPEQRAQRREEMRTQRQQQVTPERRAQQEQRRTEMQQRMETLRPIMQQLQDSNQQARREVEAVLTDEQRARLRELQPQRGNRPERAQPGQRGQHRGGR